ncbi:cell division ATPase MinD [Methanocella conradii]|uniref:cell division ATPase MinD n=1 Tax=Methanocella conradii TaxID=1175444 RepID=UPI0024B3933A|nr:cell division ATPase MinD [Methanocella conradii]MDI6896452.1 cell division ATPase MinD [Methanocella conradii]
MQAPSLTKYWDEKRGRMSILLKNGEKPLRDISIEDEYPTTLEGMICFAKSGGIAPVASASGGKMVWKVASLAPGEVKELIYTALTREALDGLSPKRPTPADAALLSSMASRAPALYVGQAEVKGVEEPAREEHLAEKEKAERRAVVIAVGAGKGGTGKTTFAINLGVALAEMGCDTVLMDADTSMGNLSTYVGLEPQSLKATLHEVLAGEAEPDKAVYRAFSDRLRLVPSGLSLEGFLKMDRSLLKDVIEHFSKNADFVVIDTPAGYNKELALSLAASDHLILVLNPDEGSMTDGLKVQEMAKILKVNVLGVVLNRYDMKNPQFSPSQVEEHFGTPVIAMLPEEPGVRRKDKVPAVLASPSSKMSMEVYRVAEMVSGVKAPAESPSFASRLMLALFRTANI